MRRYTKAGSLDAQLREAVLEAGQAAAARSELERRLEDTEARHHTTPPATLSLSTFETLVD